MAHPTRNVQDLLQAIHAAVEALEELTFVLHRACASEQAQAAQTILDHALLRAGRGNATHPVQPVAGQTDGN